MCIFPQPKPDISGSSIPENMIFSTGPSSKLLSLISRLILSSGTPDNWDLVANTLALYGLVGFLRDGTHLFPLVLGVLVTIACVLLLAKPSR